ncbi:hypothetical protein AGMMS49974_05890 [Deltaproteobacteria bacterium]|nr:hypothetical protein AGMMS49974_05890 [Deltaproteobacteria bacterium]
MTFFRHPQLPHLFSLVVAVLTAVCLWYVVSVRERLEAQVEVSIDYFGIPPGLVVTDGLISKVVVRLRGPEILLRSVTQQRLVRAVNIASIKKGVTVVPLSSDTMGPSFRAFEIVDIQPTRIVINADNLTERSVPLRPILNSPLRNGALTVGNVSVTPASVLLRGPERVVSAISSLPLTIMLDPQATGDTVSKNIVLDTPSLVTAVPSSVQVRYTITSGRTVLLRQCKVNLFTENSQLYDISPTVITVLVEVPEALSKNTSYLGQLDVNVVPPSIEPGQKAKADLRFRLPAGMTLLNPPAEQVMIVRKNINPMAGNVDADEHSAGGGE